MSVFDLFKEHDDEYMTGYYYAKMPNPTHTFAQQQEERQQTFRYKKATGKSSRFATVMQNVRNDNVTYTISTCDDMGFIVGGYVSTQNGLFWKIEDMVHEEQTDGNSESLLIFKSAVKTEYILRLRRMDNPWGIGK